MCWGSSATWTRHRWCCGPMCHSRSGWGSGCHVRPENLGAKRQRTDKQIGYWFGQINEGMLMRLEGKKGWGKHKKALCLFKDFCVFMDFSFHIKLGISLPLVLCARAKPSSIRKKSIHARENIKDISHCNNSGVQYWRYGNQQNKTEIGFSKDSIWPWWLLSILD